MAGLCGLYVILDEDAYGEQLLPAAREILEGGARLFQYRAKSGVQIAKLDMLRSLIDEFGAVLLINDDVAAAEAYGDGLHLGQDDLSGAAVPALRSRLDGLLLGISVHETTQVEAARSADYLGVGPYRETSSKRVCRAPIGLDGIRSIVQASGLPVCAIGGIELADIPDLRAAGVAMVAVIGALARAPDRRELTRKFCALWHDQRVL